MKRNAAKRNTLPAVIDLLRAALAGGPRNSRDLTVELLAHGCTLKQLRNAREQLRIAATRSGSGAGMRTAWSLPPTGGDSLASLSALEVERLVGLTSAFECRGLVPPPDLLRLSQTDVLALLHAWHR